MKKVSMLGSALAITLLSSTTMAADLHALTAVQTAPAPNQDKKLSATTERATCNTANAGNTGGFALCAFLSSGASGDTASYTIANERPVTGARFIQVVN